MKKERTNQDRQRWSVQELDILCDCRQKGVTFREIREKYFPFRSEKSLTERARRSGLAASYGEWTSEKSRILLNGVKAGKKYREIRKSLPEFSEIALKVKYFRLSSGKRE